MTKSITTIGLTVAVFLPFATMADSGQYNESLACHISEKTG